MPTLPHIKTDYLLIGQGLAGTLLAHFLRQAGKQIHIIDDNYPRAASKVAAGIINPVTGRRYVKSWRIDTLIPFAEQTYRQLEQLLDISCYHPRAILRALFNPGEENDWQARTHDPAYRAYMVPKPAIDLGAYQKHTIRAFDYGELTDGAQVEIGRLVQAYRSYALAAGLLTEMAFDFDQLQFVGNGIQYAHIQAERIIFCEGHKGSQNPFFSYLPFEGDKGQALIVDIPDADFQKILKHRVFIVPLASGKYWIGSTTENGFENDLPTPEGRHYLLKKLNEVLQLPFLEEAHLSAVRPTNHDRRPLIGSHPDYPQLLIFNGLGTKGASLGPYFAKHFSDALCLGQALDPAVNIERFRKKWQK